MAKTSELYLVSSDAHCEAPVRKFSTEVEAIAAAHEAAAEIRTLAQNSTLNDKVPQRQADILSEYGLTAIYVPKAFGGLGASIATVVEVVRIISAAWGISFL